ncbi:MAG: phosphoethanolamine transferase [Bacteroidales bacterium]|nr:phosphoethanolamine transferase [Candidatus Sodaliphilus fimicaballi]
MANISKKNNILSITKHVFNMLGAPLIHELPFFLIAVCSTTLIGFYFGFVQRIKSHYFILLDNLIISILVGIFFCYLLTALAYTFKNKIIKYGIYSIIFILNFFDYFLAGNFQANIGAEAFRLLAETNYNEASEFISIFASSPGTIKAIIKTIILIVLFLGFQLTYKHFKKLKSFRCYSITCSSIASFIVIIGIYYCGYFSYIFKFNTTEEILDFNYIYHFKDPFSRTFLACKTLDIAGNEIDTAIETSRNISSTSTEQKSPLNIVVVIGESFNKWHSPIYGYPLNTTPHMLQEYNYGNLIAFDDVSAPSGTTNLSIKNIFSCNSISHKEQWFNHPIFTCLFKKAGWNVYLWDNQQVIDKGTSFSFALNSFLFAPAIMDVAYTDVNKICYDYDEDLIRSFHKKCTGSKNLVIFHLNGQHARSKDRYPKQAMFEHFTSDSIKRNESYLTEKKKTLIAQYDNATLYNDFVISQIFKKFNNSNSIVIYFSDHGDEIYDYRDKYLRHLSEDLSQGMIKYILKVPFFVWVSPKYKEQNPDVIDALKLAKGKKYETDNLCHMLFSIGHISTNEYKQDRDVLSPNYKQTKRYTYKATELCPIE